MCTAALRVQREEHGLARWQELRLQQQASSATSPCRPHPFEGRGGDRPLLRSALGAARDAASTSLLGKPPGGSHAGTRLRPGPAGPTVPWREVSGHARWPWQPRAGPRDSGSGRTRNHRRARTCQSPGAVATPWAAGRAASWCAHWPAGQPLAAAAIQNPPSAPMELPQGPPPSGMSTGRVCTRSVTLPSS